MSKPVIADFVGKFNADGMARAEPMPGRVLLSEKRLVLAARENEKLTIPLRSIVDVAVGHVPPDLGEFFDSTVTVAYDGRDRKRVAAIEGSDENITKFSNVLFKVLLNGTDVTVKERASVGGRVTGAKYRSATVSVSPETVSFRRDDESFDIALESVVDFRRTTDEVAGRRRSVVAVRHDRAGTIVRTVLAIDTARRMALLGRYLRSEFSGLVSDLQELELSETQRRLVVAEYSAGPLDDRSLTRILDASRSEVTELRETLETAGLLADRETDADEPNVTRLGAVVVVQYLRDPCG